MSKRCDKALTSNVLQGLVHVYVENGEWYVVKGCCIRIERALLFC